ncbi:helix-turn-helix transcriptional regulator [Mangrovihabitans endophyticus]|uniref:Helix-turn-helix transcriptional regulator n=1 Tax=Mangrovihabitans endophyticus TaxID=1751298 RepID=A0A8J3BXL9_9ACTN|nr:LuxR C-terminal-related transcriptional regulator [Mangrovihabitans endophyticus]GGK78835.1 helix-turn-helix transcriptional regulator [Mangrovihabitans endophyticus]
MKQVRVALFASTPFGRAGLVSYLQPHPAVALLPESDESDVQVAVVCCDRLTPEVMTTIRRLAAGARTAFVLAVNEITETELLLALHYRVVQVLPRTALTADLLTRSVLDAADSNGVMPVTLCDELMRHIERLQQEVLHPQAHEAGLSPREIDILRLLADGMDTDAIAVRLCYSQRTVKNVIYGLTRRLNLRNRPHAVAYAVRTGII